MLVRPCPPAPISATFTLSLGGTKPRPPRTCRGTIVNTPTAAAPALRNSRREDRSAWVMGGFPLRMGRGCGGPRRPGRGGWPENSLDTIPCPGGCVDEVFDRLVSPGRWVATGGFVFVRSVRRGGVGRTLANAREP